MVYAQHDTDNNPDTKHNINNIDINIASAVEGSLQALKFVFFSCSFFATSQLFIYIFFEVLT